MSKREIKKMIKNELNPDTVGTNKNGNIICRWGFFYTHGKSAQTYANAVSDFLNSKGISFSIVNSEMIWKAFRGGASTANQSHFRVDIRIEKNPL